MILKSGLKTSNGRRAWTELGTASVVSRRLGWALAGSQECGLDQRGIMSPPVVDPGHLPGFLPRPTPGAGHHTGLFQASVHALVSIA